MGRLSKDESAFEEREIFLANHVTAAEQRMKRKSKVNSAGHSDSIPRELNEESSWHILVDPSAKEYT